MLALLDGAGLPLVGVQENLGAFVVVERDGDVVGCGGVERYGSEDLTAFVFMRDALPYEDERGRWPRLPAE